MKKGIFYPALVIMLFVSGTLLIQAQSVKDINGNEYTVRQIGQHQWMGENLNVSSFRNGDPIPEARTADEWVLAATRGEPAWCNYNNDTLNGRKFGKLYNWYAVTDPRGLAPDGWHIPSNSEWTALTGFLGGVDIAGKKLKKTEGWTQRNKASNKYHYSALPSGMRINSGKFREINNQCQWWSTTGDIGGSDQVYSLMLSDTSIEAFYVKADKGSGSSVRCVKN